MRKVTRLAHGVWALGFVSLFMDVSSEMIHGLLPVFLVGTLGISAAGLGLIEGVAESAAAMAKLFSGWWSDRIGRRKPLALLGYGLAAITKPMFPLADSAVTIFAARFIDRIGKGIRGAPRDALVADLTAPEQRGAAFGLRQTLDTVGAVLGPLVAIGLMLWLGGAVRTVFWWATLPALVAVGILFFAVHEPSAARPPSNRGNPLSGVNLRRFPRPFWRLVLIVMLFTLARFSEAFLVLRVQSAGVREAYAPLTLVVMSLTYAVSAYPAGALSDRIPRHWLLGAGCAVLVLADVILAFGGTAVVIFAGVAIWGVHLGLTEGLLAALTADHAPADLRGTAFGVVNFVRAVMLLLASVVAGAMWTQFGPPTTFLTAAVLALLAGLLAIRGVKVG